MPVFPHWLDVLCSLSLLLGFVCAIVLLVDVLRHPPRMSIMGLVWPISALFGTVFVLWLYIHHGRELLENSDQPGNKSAHADTGRASQPVSLIVAKGTLHCGAGCTLGDVVAEWLAFSVPAIAVAFGWHSLFAEKLYAVWVLDFILAFAFGVVFQYLAIVPMRHLSARQGIVTALKADALSLAAWQIGMYCMMGYLQFGVFDKWFGGHAPIDSIEFWGAMQLAMIAGFITSFPMNWWLIKVGIKERM